MGALQYKLVARTVAPRIHAHRIAGNEPSLEERERERVDQPLLNHTLQRPRPVCRVIAEVPEQRPRRVGQLDLDIALADTLDQARDLEVDDLRDLLAGQRLELDDVVETVDELGFELRLHAGTAAR